MIGHRFKNNVKNAETYIGVDIKPYHKSVVINVEIKLKTTR